MLESVAKEAVAHAPLVFRSHISVAPAEIQAMLTLVWYETRE